MGEISKEDEAPRATNRRCFADDVEERASELEFINGLPWHQAELLARRQCGCGGKQFSSRTTQNRGTK